MKNKTYNIVGDVNMLNKIKKLIDVKSIVTISLTIVFCVLTLRNQIPEKFLTIYTVVISFYFGTQYNKVLEETRIIDELKKE